MNNNPFENGTDNTSFSTDVKQTNPILKIIGLVIIVVLFIAIVVVLFKIADVNETIINRNNAPLNNSIETHGTDTTLNINDGTDCLSSYSSRNSCEQFTVGTNIETGIYTVTIDYNFDAIADMVEGADFYNELPKIYFELDLKDYQGLDHRYLSDYYEFFLMNKEPIVLQNVPLFEDSNIQVFDNSKDLNISLDLVAQDSYIAYDNDDPQAGFYTTNSVLDGRTYTVDGTSKQVHVVEYVPNSYEKYDYDEYNDLYYDNNDTFEITDDSMVVVYDDNIHLYKED